MEKQKDRKSKVTLTDGISCSITVGHSLFFLLAGVESNWRGLINSIAHVSKRHSADSSNDLNVIAALRTSIVTSTRTRLYSSNVDK